MLFASSDTPGFAPRFQAVLDRPDLFNGEFAAFFGISADPRDAASGQLQNRVPGYRFLWKQALTAARAYGVTPREATPPGQGLRPLWVVIDPTMRVIDCIPFEAEGSDSPVARASWQASPNQAAITRRVLPDIRKVHHFDATRMERYIVSCYDAAEGGHFSPHRDNTTSGTAHRRCAVSITLNDAFAGGQVSFPEYGPEGLKAPAGGAVVFSCSLLHRVAPVTSGRRCAFLPFLYDKAAAKLREANPARLNHATP